MAALKRSLGDDKRGGANDNRGATKKKAAPRHMAKKAPAKKAAARKRA